MDDPAIFRKPKFHIPKHAKIWAILCAVSCLIIYLIMLIVIYSEPGEPHYRIYVIRDVSLVVTTILFTSIATGLLIDVHSKNDLYEDTVIQDVLANPVFYQNFSLETKRTMLSTLETELRFSDRSQVEDMFRSVESKLSVLKECYYYTECSYRVVVYIRDNIITKRINRTVRLRSYKPQDQISDFLLLNWAGQAKSSDGVPIAEPFRLIQVQINGEIYPVEKVRFERLERPASDNFCSYDGGCHCIFPEGLDLSSEEDTIISVSYETKVPFSDNIYTCRSFVPCKRFSVDVHMDGSDGYILNAAAFGFQDTAKRSPQRLNRREVQIVFDDWVFQKDGVVIVFAPSDRMREDTPGA